MTRPRQITLAQWDDRYADLCRRGLRQTDYGGPLSHHVDDGDHRLTKLLFDDSPAALRLWNLLLTEEDRLHAARQAGKKIVGVMKDLGTIPVMAYALDNLVAFYPDGAWWIPCIMEHSTPLLEIADSLGIDESFCPVRAMLGAFVNGEHFPIPDLLVCSVGAVCDDFSAIAQRLPDLGFDVLWWEIPHRRAPDAGEPTVQLPGNLIAPKSQVEFVMGELDRVRRVLADMAGRPLNDDALSAGIEQANLVRVKLAQLRTRVFTAEPCPMPALEMLIAEMLAIHYCSDRDETLAVLDGLIAEVDARLAANDYGPMANDSPARIFWVNPVADIRVMNLLEQCGGRICGTEYLFSHALDPIDTDVPPLEALARSALADLMVGPVGDRAARILADMERFGSEALLISRIPGASHCALEGRLIADVVSARRRIPILEIEVPSISDAMRPTLQTRIEALVETAVSRRNHRLTRLDTD